MAKKLDRRGFLRSGVIPTLAVIGFGLAVTPAHANCFGETCKAYCSESCVESCRGDCMGDCQGKCGGCDSTCTGSSKA